MFYVHPNAEVKVPAAFSPNGERSYRWIEFSLQCNYFLLTLSLEIEPGTTLGNRLLVGRVEDVLDVARNTSPANQLRRVDLMSPGYLRGKEDGGYRLDRLIEVWRDRGLPSHYRFKLENDTWIDSSFGVEASAEPDMELLLTI